MKNTNDMQPGFVISKLTDRTYMALSEKGEFICAISFDQPPTSSVVKGVLESLVDDVELEELAKSEERRRATNQLDDLEKYILDRASKEMR